MVRRLRVVDLPAARALARLAGVPVGAPEGWEAAADRDGRDDRIVLVAHDPGQRHGLIGVLEALVAGDDVEVLLVAVEPAARRRGVGRALLAAVTRDPRARGATRVLLEVRAGNTAARALYAAEGMDEIATRAAYYRDGEDAILLERALAGPGPPGDR